MRSPPSLQRRPRRPQPRRQPRSTPSAYSWPTGFIDATGRFVIPPTLWAARKFSEGLVGVELKPDEYGYHAGFMDKTGAWVIEPTGPHPPYFASSDSFSEGLCPAADGSGKRGYIDKTGAWVIEPQFFFGQPFFDGLALVGIGGESGDHLAYIDRTGKVIWRSKPSP